MPKSKKRRKAPSQKPVASGWLTTDADEIERRRWRGANESFQIDPDPREQDFFSIFDVRSETGQRYRIEIRSLVEPVNACNCPDHRINGLGTCKHIEAVLHRLQHRRKRLFREAAAGGSPFFEVFLDRRDDRVKILWPRGSHARSMARDLLRPWFSEEGILVGKALDRLPALRRAVDGAGAATRRKIRLSGELQAWLEALDWREQQQRARQHFETEVALGRMSLDVVKHKLYPYQQEGMLHLAFTGRAMLADEMGLGKTVQAIAACELLRRLRNIRRVLVVAPASLKGEWEDQISKFTDLSARIIEGPRARRLRQYQRDFFFSIASYEQIRSDAEEIDNLLEPDVIILDEAQRIKNWQTKTANAVKHLKSPYAFVLTGTPLENRIDEIYSIAQFLDPQLFGPLFRFNREYYQLDEKGRAIGYRNLDQLHERLRPVMLRRRKADVEGELPGRTINTYFVPMHSEQSLRYQEYEARVARLAAMARKRPLTREELQRLQQNLACMRMLCDTPYILDQDCRVSPKLKELATILREIMAVGDHKIILFSEWEGMLHLVRELAEEMELGHAWHTGKVPQPQRREEIRRFKQDPDCKLFLSTDSGAVGLNLQVADVVINLDMPWNPAKLEQRIARAWRKHQRRSVQVVNLVTEHSIEHRMLALLDQKRSLAAGVIDGSGERDMLLPSGRSAFLERLDVLLAEDAKTAPAAPVDPSLRLRDELLTRWRHQLERIELHDSGERQTLLVVTESANGALETALKHQLQTQFPDKTPQLKLLDHKTFAAVQQLIGAGMLSAGPGATRTLYAAGDEAEQTAPQRQLTLARQHLDKSERKRCMARLLADGGFVAEALAPMREAVEIALQALAIWQGQTAEIPLQEKQIDALLLQTHILPADTLSLLAHLREPLNTGDESQARALLKQSDELLSQAALLLGTSQT